MISVIYVDDEPDLLEIGKLFLERTGRFSVETAKSAREALEKIRTRHYEAIISDYQMPGLNGIEFLKEVRASGNRIPFIIFTGRGREEIVIQALNEGADFYLQKGGDPLPQFAELAHKVEMAVQQRRAETSIRDHERRETDIINFLPDATFAIDTNGVVIAWNRAMERMTGVNARDMIGKDNYEYAIPFYHERRPILIDLVLKDRPEIAARYASMKKEGKTLFAEVTSPYLNDGRGAALWFTASPLFDNRGRIIGAIESIRDISERKRAEETLQQSEIRFRSLIQNSSDMIRILDRDGKIVYESPSAEIILGYPAGENLGKDPLTFIHPDDVARARAGLGQVYDRTNPGIPTEFRIRKSDGTYIWVDSVGMNLLDVPAVNGVVMTIRPIDQRKKMETALRESEEKYRTVFETTGTATVLIENDGTISLANTEFERLSGYTKEEIENGMKWTKFVVSEDLDRMTAQHKLRRSSPKAALKHYEFGFMARSGDIRYVYLTIDVIPGSTRSVASLLDITEQKAAEQNLIAANREYTGLLNQIQDIYYRSDAEGRLIRASRSWADLLGYGDIAECLGRNIADDFYYNPEDRNLLLEEVYRDGKVTNYEIRLRRKDGTPVLVATSSHLYFGSSGNVLGVEGTFRDITERKKMETALRESEQRYRNIYENTLVGIFRSTPAGRYLEMNPAFAGMFGYASPQEMIEAITDIRAKLYVRPEDRDAFLESLARDGRVQGFEAEFYHKNGSRIWISINAVAVRDTSGTILYYEGTTEDITERKQQDHILKVQLELGVALQKMRGLPETLDACLSAAIDISGMDAGGIYLFDEQTGAVDLAVFRNLGDDFVRSVSHYPAGSVNTEMVMNRKPRYILYNRTGVIHTPGQEREGLKALAIVPITYKGMVTGCLNIASHVLEEIPAHSRLALETLAIRIGNAIWRIRAGEDLAASEERYRNIVEDQTEFISRFLPDGTHVFVNEAYCRYFGLIREGILGHRFRPKIPPEDRDRVRRFFATLTPEHPVDIIEHRIIMTDGSVRWQRWSDRAIFDENGALVEYQSVGRDVTDRKAAEAALYESEERNAAIIAAMPDLLFVISRDGTYLDFQAADPGLLAVPPDQILRKNILDAGFDPVVARTILTAISAAIDSGELQQVEYDLAVPSGTRHFEARLTRLGTDRVLGIVRDTTEKKITEDALIQSERKFRTIMDQASDAIILHDRTGRIVDVNRKACDNLGYTKAELLTKQIADFDPHAIRDGKGDLWKDVISGRTFTFESFQVRKDGTSFPVEVTLGPIQLNEEPLILGVIRDITERRKLEVALREDDERLRTIMESVKTGIVLIDAKTHRILEANPQALEMIGSDAGGVIGSVCHRFICPAEEGKCPITDLHQQVDASERFLVTCGGEQIPVLKTVVSAKISGKEMLVESFSDISELKKKEDRIRVLGGLLDLIPASVTVHDPSGRFLYANAKAFESHGYTEEEFYRVNLYELDVPERAQLIDEHIRQLKENGEASFEAAHFRKDRSVLPLLVNAKITTWEGSPVILSIATDITERKRMEEAVRDSQRDFVTLADNSPDLIVRFDTEFRHIYGNQAAERETGFPLAQTFGRRPSELPIPGPVAAFMEASLDKALTSGTEQRVDQEFPTPDGPRLYETRIVPEHDETGTIVSLLAISRDITERKRAEEALKESEVKYRDLVNIAREGIWVVDPQGITTFVNPAMAAMLGFTTDEMIGSPMYRFMDEKEQEIARTNFPKYRDGLQGHVEFAFLRKDGNRILTSVSNSSIFNPAGVYTGTLAVISDITAQKKSQKALKESEARFSMLFNASPVPLMLTSPDDGSVKAVNEAALSLFGYARNALLGKTTRGLGIWANPEERRRILAEIKKTGVVRNAETTIRTGTGRLRSVIFNSVLTYSDGVPAIITAYYDITDRKLAEEQLVAAYAEYQNLLDNGQDAYYRTDNAGRLVRISRSLPAAFGYDDISELLGKNIAEEFYFDPSERDAVLKEIERKGSISGYEVRLKRRDGTPVWISANSHLWHNPDGSVGGVEGTFRDITEQKAIADALRKKTEELDYRNRVITTLLDTVPIGIFMVEATSGKPIFANRRATWLLGRGVLPDATEENLAGVYEVYRAGTDERYPAKEMPVIRGMYGESSHVDDLEVVRPDGTRIRLEIFGTPVFDAKGRIAASLVSFIDITDRKHTEELIYRLAQFPAENPLPILRITCNGMVLYANEPGRQWLAALHGSVKGRMPLKLQTLVDDAMANRGIRTLEVEDDAGHVYTATATRPEGEDYVNMYVSDITDRKRAEQIILETNKKINLLTSITRHDVANQVTILRAFAQIALEKHPDPAVAELLEKILAAGTTIFRQIEFTRAYQELGVHAPGWHSVRDLVLREKPAGITVTCTCDAEIFADPMLEKVFFNLIDNAVRHGERVTEIAVGCGMTGEECIVTVLDNGIGVAPELKEKIFEKGYGKHTGFGLFLAREILAITGISIHEDGTFGKGARFSLRVPAGGYRSSS